MLINNLNYKKDDFYMCLVVRGYSVHQHTGCKLCKFAKFCRMALFCQIYVRGRGGHSQKSRCKVFFPCLFTTATKPDILRKVFFLTLKAEY